MSNPHVPWELPDDALIADAEGGFVPGIDFAPPPFNPDPLRPPDADVDRAAELDEAWEAGYTAAVDDRRWRRTEILLAIASGAMLGFFLAGAIAHAAPRPGLEQPASTGRASAQGQLGAPLATPSPSLSAARSVTTRAGGASSPAADLKQSPAITIDVGTAIEGGLLAYADPGLGDRYLAIPSGPGHRVRICIGRRCLDRTSTDAGPALFRQREGRIADVSFVDFAWLCRCDPPAVGLIAGSLEWLDEP